MLKGRCSRTILLAICGVAITLSLSAAAPAIFPAPENQSGAQAPRPDTASPPGFAADAPHDGQSAVVGELSLHPEVVNLKAKGTYLTGFLELPEGYSVLDVYLPSVRLNGVVYVETCFGHQLLNDHGDGAGKLLLKFVKLEARQALSPGEGVTVFITGTMTDGTPLYAQDVVTVVGS